MRKTFPLAIILALLILVIPRQPARANGPLYTVQPGDSLYSIALQYHVDVTDLAAANRLEQNSWIQPGQQLYLPIQPAAAQTTGQWIPQPAPSNQPAGQWAVQPLPNYPTQSANTQPIAGPPVYASNTWTTIDPYTGYQPAPAGNYPQPQYTLSTYPPVYQPTYPQQQSTALPANSPAPYSNRLPQNYYSRPYSLPQPNNDLITPNGPKWIDINLSTQTLTAMEGQTPIYRVLVSTGTWAYPTVEGTYEIYVKYEHADMTGGSGADFYDLADVPYVMYFHGSYGLHGTYWHNNFGVPMSHGCVNLRTPDAQWLFLWAPLGTKVVSHY
jgi:lipoprotein-anchoring transpeptidase ErfK/SrfK